MTGKCKILVFLALIAAVSSACAQDQNDLVVFCGAGLTGAFNEIGEIF